MTAQVHEVLLMEGKRRDMRTVPDLPARHARIVDVPLWEREEAVDAVIDSTACWRQYIGTWEIRDGRLYLRSIHGRYAVVGDEEIWASWYSGELHVRGTETERPPHAAEGDDLVFTVRQGLVTETRRVSALREARREDARIWEDLTAYEEYEDDGY